MSETKDPGMIYATGTSIEVHGKHMHVSFLGADPEMIADAFAAVAQQMALRANPRDVARARECFQHVYKECLDGFKNAPEDES